MITHMFLHKKSISSLAILSIVFIFCLSSKLEASVNWSKFSYFTNWLGLNDSYSVTEIKDEEATDLQNVVFDVGGSIKKRKGYTTIPSDTTYTISNGTDCVVTGVYIYRKNDGNRYLLTVGSVENTRAIVSEKTYQVGGGLPSGTYVDITGGTGTLPSTGYLNTYMPSFTTAEDTVVFAIPSTTGKKPYAWTGSGTVTPLTSDSNAPNCSIVVYHKNMLFTNNTDNPSRIHFTDLTAGITSFPIINFIDIATNDGTKVRAMISAFNALYIFKDRSIWCLTGSNTDDFVLQKFVDGVGTKSPQSVGVLGNYIYFVDQQGNVNAYDGVYVIQAISNKIRNTIGGLNFTRTGNIIAIPFSTYRYTNYDFYVGTSSVSSSTNDTVLVYDTEKKAWTKFKGINPSSWCLGDDSVGQNIIIFGDYNGYVHYYPSTGYKDGNVNNSAIDAYYQTKWFKYPEVSLGNKYWMLLKTYALSESGGSTLTINCGADYQPSLKNYLVTLNQSGALWDTGQWDISTWVGQSLIIDRREVNLGSNMFQLKFSNANLDEGFTINGFEIFLQPDDRI